jgi:XRE family aerobic/anaerobic benzoate catabolism transcriptional regulator
MTDAEDAAETEYLRLVGERVRDLRKATGLTQSGLEQTARLRPPTIAQLERGEADVSLLCLARIARALGLPMAELLPAEGSTEDHPR